MSGQNVAYLAGGVVILAWLLGIPRPLGHLAVLPAIACYVLAVGWQPSVVRAGVAGALASLAWLAARQRDRWYVLLVGAFVLLAWNPYNLVDPGFQLSFVAVGAIFLLVPRVEAFLAGYPLPRPLAGAVAVSVACTVATAPLVWLHFGALPLFGLLANVLAAPAVAPLLGLALAAAGLEPVLPGAAAALGWLNGWVAVYLAGCARIVAALPHAQVSSLRGAGVLLAVCTLLLAAGRSPPRTRRRLLGAALLTAVAFGVWSLWPAPSLPPPRGLRITFLDVGQGDGVLLQVPEGAVLVDQGPPEARVAEQLGRLGVHRLALLVLTHPQRDHIGGAADVLRKLDVDLALDPRLPAPSSDEAAALAAARRRRVPVRLARAGLRYRLGALRLRVLWPDGPGSPGQDPNDHATVLLASYGRVDVLLTADAESNVTLPRRPPQVEILKLAHHGSADPLLPGLLRLTRPRIAVISVGAGNDYGHPTSSTLRALEAVPGLDVYRTDRDGRVTLESDGRRIVVQEER
ncbi:MAG: ComEC/Rec2 family competence protein [Actinobacteria bacterium]|nr:ComEC/Rec2 family competence protein [Actinomycetota bacterium]